MVSYWVKHGALQQVKQRDRDNVTTVHGVLLSRTRSPATSQTTWQGQRDYSSWCLTESNTEPCNKANNVTVTTWLQFMVSYWVKHGALQQGKQRDSNNVTTVHGVLLSQTRSPAIRQTNVTGTTWLQFMVSYWVEHGALQQVKQRDRDNVTTVHGVLLSRTRSPATRQTTWQGQRDYSSWCLTESNTEPCNKANNVTVTTWLQFMVSYWVEHGALQQGKQSDRDNVTTVHGVLLSQTRSPATRQTTWQGQRDYSSWCLTESNTETCNKSNKRDSNNVTTVHGVLLSQTRSPATRQTTWQGQRDYSSWCLTESNTEPCNKANNVTVTTWLQFMVSYWVKHGALQQGKQRDSNNVTTVHGVLLSQTRSPAIRQTTWQ